MGQTQNQWVGGLPIKIHTRNLQQSSRPEVAPGVLFDLVASTLSAAFGLDTLIHCGKCLQVCNPSREPQTGQDPRPPFPRLSSRSLGSHSKKTCANIEVRMFHLQNQINHQGNKLGGSGQHPKKQRAQRNLLAILQKRAMPLGHSTENSPSGLQIWINHRCLCCACYLPTHPFQRPTTLRPQNTSDQTIWGRRRLGGIQAGELSQVQVAWFTPEPRRYESRGSQVSAGLLTDPRAGVSRGYVTKDRAGCPVIRKVWLKCAGYEKWKAGESVVIVFPGAVSARIWLLDHNNQECIGKAQHHAATSLEHPYRI